MTKILNKLFYIFKNILLPVIFVGTLYIVIFMFKRLDKELFGANLMEFLRVVIPFILLIIFSLIVVICLSWFLPLTQPASLTDRRMMP